MDGTWEGFVTAIPTNTTPFRRVRSDDFIGVEAG